MIAGSRHCGSRAANGRSAPPTGRIRTWHRAPIGAPTQPEFAVSTTSTRPRAVAQYESYGGEGPLFAYSAHGMAGLFIFICEPCRTVIGAPRTRKEAQLFSVLRREKGQGLAEYALILALIAMIVVVAVAFFGVTVHDMFENIATQFGTF